MFFFNHKDINKAIDRLKQGEGELTVSLGYGVPTEEVLEIVESLECHYTVKLRVLENTKEVFFMDV